MKTSFRIKQLRQQLGFSRSELARKSGVSLSRLNEIKKLCNMKIKCFLKEILRGDLCKKSSKLYNVIFPLWVFVFFPPYLFLVLLGNLLIDSLVIYLTLYFNRVKLNNNELRSIILKAWAFGFVADIIGALILLLCSAKIGSNGYYAFESFTMTVSFITSVFVAGFLIACFNYYQSRKLMDSKIAILIGLAMGIITAPWMFFIPTPY